MGCTPTTVACRLRYLAKIDLLMTTLSPIVNRLMVHRSLRRRDTGTGSASGKLRSRQLPAAALLEVLRARWTIQGQLGRNILYSCAFPTRCVAVVAKGVIILNT